MVVDKDTKDEKKVLQSFLLIIESVESTTCGGMYVL